MDPCNKKDAGDMADSAENTPAVEYPSVVEAYPPPQRFTVSLGLGSSEYDEPAHVVITPLMFPNIIGYTRVDVPSGSFHICSERWPVRIVDRGNISIRVTPNTEIEICISTPSYTSGVYWTDSGWTPYGAVRALPAQPFERVGLGYYRTDTHYRREFYLIDIE